VAQVNEDQPFSFTWLALKLLGQGLYSNPWSALSELVANGLDAGATTVSVYIDLRTKSRARVEIFDNGIGMSRDDIRIYAQVGHNKRSSADTTVPSFVTSPMGRKGIGKLAALYLSRDFYIRTRREGGGDSGWRLDAREDIDDEAIPFLQAVDQLPASENMEMWEGYPSGTMLLLEDVDLRGYGEQSFVALSARLANQFLLPEVGPVVQLFVRTESNASEPLSYEPVRKEVAFRNLVFISTRFAGTHPRPAELDNLLATVELPAPRLRERVFKVPPEEMTFTSTPSSGDDETAALNGKVEFDTQTYAGHHYSLEGWIGIHASINSEPAQKNDSRFRKNKYYNPAQLRVYVRGKLASDRLLSQLGITGTYLNYIEGEISFDILDVDSLNDIATSSRQDFDESDDRVMLLRALVRPVVRGLIQKRNDLAAEIAKLAAAQKDETESNAKAAFSKQLEADLSNYPEIPVDIRSEIQLVTTNKIKGDVTPKDEFRVFISHSREDKPFADLVYELLLSRGAVSEEVFYTSKTGATSMYGDPRALGDVIKQNIISANTLLFYLTSKNFKSSEFCLFEGGAGWATRAVTEYLKLNVDYDSIPSFLSNSKAELQMMSKGSIALTPELHNFLIEGVLNPMIEHLNHGRTASGSDLIAPFDPVVFPTAVVMKAKGTGPTDYYDAEVVAHWAAHVEPALATYLIAYSAGKS
jgi:hypothetical protein